MVGGVAEQDLRGFGAFVVQVQVVLPGEADAAVDLNAGVADFAGGCILDFKTTLDARPSEFERSIFKYGYHRQGAMYLEAAAAHGIPAKHYVIIASEKVPPYGTCIYRLTEGAISNLFWIRGGTVFTPDVECGLLPGIPRQIALERCAELAIPTEIGAYPEQALIDADEAFCTNSLRGLMPVTGLLDSPQARVEAGPAASQLQRAYAALASRRSVPGP